MADLTVTAASVVAGSNASIKRVTAGAAVTAGQPVYKDTTDFDQYKAADADAGPSAEAEGIALHAAGDNQPLSIITKGDLNPGATVTVGQLYVVSTNAGGIAPYGDLASGDFVTILGVGTTTSNIDVQINRSGVAKA